MSNVLEIVFAISTPMQVGWVVVSLWAVGQIVWWRRGRVVVLPPMAPSPRRKQAPIHVPSEAAHTDHEAAPI